MKSILAVAVLFSVVVAACGLKCFKCNSHNDTACGDLFHDSSQALQDAYLKECHESPEGLHPFCRKTRTYRNGEIRVHRECAYLERVGYECYQQRSDDFITEVCQCKSPMCNSATTFGVATLALALPFTVMALL